MVQHGQVFKLKTTSASGKPVWHTGIGCKGAARSGSRSAGSRPVSTRNGPSTKRSIGCARVGGRRR